MVGAANHMRDAHIDVVHHYAKLIGGQTRRTQQYEVLDFGILHVSWTEDRIFKMGGACARSAKTNRRGNAFFLFCGALFERQIAARTSGHLCCLAFVVTFPFVLLGCVSSGVWC